MQLSQLRALLAVVRSGSLRSASRALGVSQPAVTKSLRQLEQELHVRLLQRSARGASLTPAGKAFAARAKAIEAELRKAEEDLEAFRGGREGSVAFGIAPAACMLLVPDAVQHFRRRHPHATVRIVEGVNTELLPLVRDESLDFTVGQSSLHPDSALRFRPLFKPQLIVAARHGHPLGGARSLRELLEAQWIMFYRMGTGAILEKMFQAAGLPLPRGVVHCESYAAALALLVKSDALALVIPQMLGERFGQQHLREIRIAEKVEAPLIGMYSRADAPFTPAAATMAQAVTATARRLAKAR
jgi:DNA-binding transcriptional LysR family regulator